MTFGEALDVEEGLDQAGEAFRFRVDHFAQLFLLGFGERIVGHDFAGPLDGGERGAHFVGGPVDGLLVARFFGFAAAELAAHEEVLIGGGAGSREPGYGGGSEEREH